MTKNFPLYFFYLDTRIPQLLTAGAELVVYYLIAVTCIFS